MPVGSKATPPEPAPFLVGVNLPWITYGGDFGANAWSPGGGLSRGERAVELDRVLGRLAAHGVHAVRWFLLCDARAGVRVDAAGRPAGIDDALRRDLDTALARLDRHGVRALFVLFDFLLLRRARVHQRVQMFGRRRWVANAEARARLLDLVVGPVVAHVRDADAVMGWDLMNEPEWVTMGEGGRVPWHCVSRSTMRGFLAEAARTVREAGPQPVTVGLASLRGLDLVGGLGLDFYQVHWYDHVDAPSALVTPAAAHGLDRPLVLGEFPTLQSGQRPLNVLAAVAHAGYAGAFAWSYCAEDQFSSAAVCDDEVAGWQPPRP